jgi:DNA-binding transcriptional regulator YdaS (Cro superfamily)
MKQALRAAQIKLLNRGRAVRGGQTALAIVMGVSTQRVSQWCADGYMPPRRAAQAERLLGIPAHELMDPALIALARGE